jgi:hypothetical protein
MPQSAGFAPGQGDSIVGGAVFIPMATPPVEPA